MPDRVEVMVLAVFMLSTSVWVGGYVAIVVVARVATATLAPGPRVVFFRSLGRSYLWVGLPALIVALITGGALGRDLERGALFVTTAVVAAALLVSVSVAVAQARRMSLLRHMLLSAPDDIAWGHRVRRGARVAGGLRAALGVFTVALVVLGAFLAA